MTAKHLPDQAWRSLLSAPEHDDALTIAQLAEEFRVVEQDRADLGMLAGPRRRDEPGYRWLPYKEAFSPGLVRAILDQWPGLDGVLVDIFAGSATSLLVAAERGLDSVGVELLPYAQWAADAVVRARMADPVVFRDVVTGDVDAARSGGFTCQQEWPVPAAAWAVSGEAGSAILALR